MGILRKVVRQKKYDEKQESYLIMYKKYAHLPPHMQPYEFTTLQAERNKKGMLELSNFLKELLDKPQDVIDDTLSKQQDNGK